MERTHLSFLMLMLLCFLVYTKAREHPPYKEIPGGITTNPMDRILVQANRTKLRIGVPPKFEPNGVFQVKHDDQTNSTVISGFCADVFQTAFNALGLDVSFHVMSFADGRHNYTSLIYHVYLGVGISLYLVFYVQWT